ncbi:MAG: PPC domain-containing protein [Chthoniobacteraceae bacterium]|nr:PPC domain-containing protein [Chthoniobacteraceae bacterium]
MPHRLVLRMLAAVLLLGAGALPAPAQQGRRLPRIGYLFPAGVQRGTSCEITAGGQFLDGVTQAFVSGSGVTVTLLRYEKPLPGKRMTELRDYLQEARKKETDALAQAPPPKPFKPAQFNRPEHIAEVLKESGATDDEIREFLKKRQQENDPKRQPNQQISETAIFKVDAAPDAAPGPRELRLLTTLGLTNPLAFCVGTLPESCKEGQTGKTLDTAPRIPLPSVYNGQILPGETHRVAFQARRGARLVAAIQGRDLIPYLADAVPGWFQPVVTLTDEKGHEVAYANAFRFSPDPVLTCEIPADGLYLLEIRDALYRGREDFVYRLTVGEIPFVTGIYPLGGPANAAAAVDVAGWNLSRKRVIVPPQPEEGPHPVPGLGNGFVIGDTAFDAGTLPETEEKEPNNTVESAQTVRLPAIVNGRIATPGDEDVFAISCQAGARIVAEVTARRLNSPLDSWLKITDALGAQVAFNDDQEDKAAGLLTHQADSLLRFTAPSGGTYYVHLGDAQKKGGPEYAYRLRISAPRPGFALRWVPSSLNAPRPGVTLPFTVYALRQDGFDGDIQLAFKDPPPGFAMQGGCIPAGQEKVRVTVTFPPEPSSQPIPLTVEGRATVAGREILRPAVPADDMLQAFAYHHLVPAQALLACVSGTARVRAAAVPSPDPVTLAPGGTVRALIRMPNNRPSAAPGELQVQLSEPPDGIRVESVEMAPEGVALTLRADASVAPGLRGNLIAEAFMERTPPPQEGKKPEKKRWSIGLLPALPFEIAKPAPSPDSKH